MRLRARTPIIISLPFLLLRGVGVVLALLLLILQIFRVDVAHDAFQIVTVYDSPEIRRLEYFRHGMEKLQVSQTSLSSVRRGD